MKRQGGATITSHSQSRHKEEEIVDRKYRCKINKQMHEDHIDQLSASDDRNAKQDGKNNNIRTKIKETPHS